VGRHTRETLRSPIVSPDPHCTAVGVAEARLEEPYAFIAHVRVCGGAGWVTIGSTRQALKKVAKDVGLDLKGAYLNLDGGFDSAHNRKCIFNAGLIPNIPENPRNRKHPKRGRKRLFNAAIHALRMRVERTFAWEDKFKRLLLRFERIQQRHYGMKLMAYTLINLRKFCGT
jgi:Transposase DDE domain